LADTPLAAPNPRPPPSASDNSKKWRLKIYRATKQPENVLQRRTINFPHRFSLDNSMKLSPA
ncbi:MAG TPA: hypothetical protein VH021_09620, partial [Trebonia sp.]|nr:hypothetical protein [Trebonia sp.]